MELDCLRDIIYTLIIELSKIAIEEHESNIKFSEEMIGEAKEYLERFNPATNQSDYQQHDRDNELQIPHLSSISRNAEKTR